MFDEMKVALRHVCDAQVRIWAGMAFMALAMAAIQYDEIIAPNVSRVSDAWSSATADLGRSLAGFTL